MSGRQGEPSTVCDVNVRGVPGSPDRTRQVRSDGLSDPGNGPK
jgi:hypothetical protein